MRRWRRSSHTSGSSRDHNNSSWVKSCGFNFWFLFLFNLWITWQGTRWCAYIAQCPFVRTKGESYSGTGKQETARFTSLFSAPESDNRQQTILLFSRQAILLDGVFCRSMEVCLTLYEFRWNHKTVEL